MYHEKVWKLFKCIFFDAILWLSVDNYHFFTSIDRVSGYESININVKIIVILTTKKMIDINKQKIKFLYFIGTYSLYSLLPKSNFWSTDRNYFRWLFQKIYSVNIYL